MIQNGAILSKKRKIELPTNDQQCKDKMNEQKLSNNNDKTDFNLNKSSSSKSTTLEQNATDLILSSRACVNNKIIKSSFKINSINELDNQFNQQQTDLNTKDLPTPINNSIKLESNYYDNIISKITDKNKLNNDLFNQQNQDEEQTNQNEMDLNTFNNLDDNSQLINQDEYFTNQDDLDLLNNHNELDQSHSNSSFNFSLINEDNSNMSTTSSNTHQNTSDFELVDLNDNTANLNFTKPNNLNEWLNMFHNWTNNERLSALESLVDSEICDIQQIRFLLSIIEPQLQRDFISLLPKELALYVLSFLKPKDLLKAAQTCRYWRILCEDNLLWREKCKECGLNDEETLNELFRKRSIRNSNHRILTPAVSPISSPSTSSTNLNMTNNLIFNLTSFSNNLKNNNKNQLTPFKRSDYKLAYLRQRSIEHNWKYGYFPNESDNLNTSNVNSNSPNSPKGRLLKEILNLKAHDDHVITCLQFNPHSNIIVSGSDDNTLKVWDALNGKLKQNLRGHTGGVWSSCLSPDNIVISGSTDRTLKIWDALTGECKHTCYGHTSTVRCLSLHGDYVVSGSRDQTLRVWNIRNGNCTKILSGHYGAVRVVRFNGEIIVSGAYDFLVKVWDFKTGTNLFTLEGHTNRVYSVQFDGINIVSGSLDTSIKVWDAKTGRLKHTLLGHHSLTSGMALKGSVLVSGNADSTTKIWNIETGECLQTLKGHSSAVTCLQFNSNFVITSSDDGTVKLWNLKTGEFIRNLISLQSGGSGGVVWRICLSNTKLVCAIGSRNGTELTAIKLIDFDTEDLCNTDEIDNQFTNNLEMV